MLDVAHQEEVRSAPIEKVNFTGDNASAAFKEILNV